MKSENSAEMPAVAECAVRECAYNVDSSCRARAITVGDGLHPACDTFLRSRQNGGDGALKAGVGACKVATCRHNHGLECAASSIRIGYHGNHPDCLTYDLATDRLETTAPPPKLA
jgi:hypothetical protein